MKAIVHMGIEKTGTTALQSFLTENRFHLKEKGYAYLESAGLPSNRKLATYCIDQSRFDDHHQMLNIVESSTRKAWNNQFIHDFYKEIDNLESHIHTVIISNEQLHSRLILESEIDKVRNTLEKKFDDIEIIVYLRRQDQLAISLYSTALKCGHSFDSILPGVTNTNHYYNFEVLLGKWATIFGKESITTRLFDKSELVDGDLFADFLTSCNINNLDLSTMILPGRQNESLEPKAQAFLSTANHSIPMMVDGKFNQLRAHLTYHLEKEFSGSPGLPLKDEAIAFCNKFQASNSNVAREWFGRENLFSEDFSSYPTKEDENRHTFEDAVYVASSILNGMMAREREISNDLYRKLQTAESQETTKLVADYFSLINPKLANYLRKNISGVANREAPAKLTAV